MQMEHRLSRLGSDVENRAITLFDATIAPTSTIVDSFIAHRMVIESVAEMVKRGLQPPIFRSANLPEGDAKNAELIKRYRSRVKDL